MQGLRRVTKCNHGRSMYLMPRLNLPPSKRKCWRHVNSFCGNRTATRDSAETSQQCKKSTLKSVFWESLRLKPPAPPAKYCCHFRRLELQ